MQGTCIYRDEHENPVLLMYKEIYIGVVYAVFYTNNELYSNNIGIKEFTNKFPHHCIHILYTLPYYNNVNLMLDLWKDIVKERLIELADEYNINYSKFVPIPTPILS